ncbi:MAG: hypothetical protein WBA61_11535 [Aequorivita sp.]
MNNIYTYKTHEYRCDKCGWIGLGEELEQGELFQDGFEVNCPKCGELFELVVFPTMAEVLEFGSEEEKKEAREQMEFRDQWEALSLESADQLPEIEGDDLIFNIEERKYKRQEFLFLMHDGKEIWKEPLMYEYYERFIEIGKILQDKYGKRMKDLVPPEYQAWLLGDRSSAPKKIREFRESLKDKSN